MVAARCRGDAGTPRTDRILLAHRAMTAAAVDSRDGPGRRRIGSAAVNSAPPPPGPTAKERITMKVGIGLPSHIAGVPGPLNTTWARHGEQRGFECVAAIDRLVYPSLDALVALALAAGATESIGLVTNILLAPLYPAAVLAKQLAALIRTGHFASPSVPVSFAAGPQSQRSRVHAITRAENFAQDLSRRRFRDSVDELDLSDLLVGRDFPGDEIGDLLF
jgi:hypothetical protein